MSGFAIPGGTWFFKDIGRGSKIRAGTEGGARAYVSMIVCLFGIIWGSPGWRGGAGRGREEVSSARLVRPRRQTVGVEIGHGGGESGGTGQLCEGRPGRRHGSQGDKGGASRAHA
jgi:hypothetical protein